MRTAYESVNTNLRKRLMRKWFHKPITLEYSKYAQETLRFLEAHPAYTPCLIPNFDHSPRSSYNGLILDNSTPDKWFNFCREIKKQQLTKQSKDSLVFIKAWNEWGEGNYIEPDLKYGKGYIEATRTAFFSI
jgi:hypothetical protein